MHFYDLPYDVRSQIYQHLFPTSEQVYVWIIKNTLRAIIPHGRIPIELLVTSKALYSETSEYLYNGYLFNLIGTKRDCLKNYERFLTTLQKHAREPCFVHAFSNGPHSSTMCISMQAGKAKMALLERRSRGQLRTISQIKSEVALTADRQQRRSGVNSWTRLRLLFIASFILVALVSLWLGAF